MAPFRDPPAAETGRSAAREYMPVAHAPSENPVERARDRHENDLMRIPGVMGVGVGQAPNGDDAILVYLRDPSVRDRIPPRVDQFPVETVVTGPIDAY